MRKYLRLIGMLLLMAALLCACGKKKEEEVTPEEPDPGPAPTVVSEEAYSVLCSDGSHTLRFRRAEDGNWQWVDDVSFPLDGQYVDQLVELTGELEAPAPLLQPESAEFYGLTGTKRYLAMQRRDGSEVVYRLGDAAEGGGYYCSSSEDEKTIRVVPEDVLTRMGRSIYDMALLPELPALTVKEIRSVTITRGDESDQLTVARDKWLRGKADVSAQDAVSQLSAALETAALTRCVDYAPASGAAAVCGLEPPAATVEIELAKTTLTLRIGSFNSSENAWYVTMNDDTTIYLMDGQLPALAAAWSAES